MSKDSRLGLIFMAIAIVVVIFEMWWWYKAPCSLIKSINAQTPGRCIQ